MGACLDCGRTVDFPATRCKPCFKDYMRAGRHGPRVTLAPTCLGSPTGAHFWELDAKDYGRCRHCGKERQFTPVFEAIGTWPRR